MACNTFIFIILFGLLESSKITLFNDLLGMIFETKVTENSFFLHFSVTLNLIISSIKYLGKVTLNYSDRPNMIVQINRLHAVYIFDVKVVYTIYPRLNTPRHYRYSQQHHSKVSPKK